MFDVATPSRLTLALRRGRWPLTAALIVALLAASWTMVGLIDGSGWWWLLVGVGTLLLLVPAMLRTLGVPRYLASVLDLVLAGLLFAACIGAAPSPAGLARLAAFLPDAAATVARASAPAAPAPELLGLIVGVGGLVAVLLDLAAVTVPALVGPVLLLVIAVPAVLLPHGLDPVALTACVLAYLLVLAIDGRIRLRVRGARIAAAVVAGATVLAVLFTGLAPGLQLLRWRAEWVTGATQGAASLIDLAQDLQVASPREVLRYETDLAAPPYLQLATLSVYDGTTWTHRDGDPTPIPEPAGAGAGAGVATTTVHTQSFSAEWAPAPYPAEAIVGGAGTWTADADDGALTLTGPSLSYVDYTVQSLAGAPDPSMLTATDVAADRTPDDVLADLALPDGLPSIITDTAAQVTAGASTLLAKAQALQDYLRSSGGFAYSLATPDDQTSDGMQVIASFLERKTGYCIHFAATMTVMARVLGIPARIAIGYLPGIRRIDPATGRIYYSETNQRLHAWPQLYLPGAGWLDFEPTVGLGEPADYTRPSSTGVSPTGAPTDAATAAAPTRSASDRPGDVTAAAPTGTATGGGSADAAGLLAWAIGIVILGIALLTPSTIRRLRRRRRLRRLAAGGPAGLGWAEVRDTARDAGIALDPAETPRAFAARLAADWPVPARTGLDALVLAVELEAFGPPSAVRADDDRQPGEVNVRRTLDVIRRLEAASRTRGALARIVPRSLLGG